MKSAGVSWATVVALLFLEFVPAEERRSFAALHLQERVTEKSAEDLQRGICRSAPREMNGATMVPG